MESIIGIIENSGAPKILILVGLCLFILSVVRRISWIELLENTRSIARYAGILLVAAGVYLEYFQPSLQSTPNPNPNGNQPISSGIITNPNPDEKYIIHFMSLSHQSSAYQQLRKIKEEHGQYLFEYRPMIDVVRHPQNGNKMYRVNFGIFEDKEEADQLCIQMLRHVNDCVPRPIGGSVYVNLE